MKPCAWLPESGVEGLGRRVGMTVVRLWRHMMQYPVKYPVENVVP
jgi:hypothetical protein